MRVGNFSFAQPDLEQSLKLDPENVSARFSLADALLSHGLHAQAAQHFEEMVPQFLLKF